MKTIRRTILCAAVAAAVCTPALADINSGNVDQLKTKWEFVAGQVTGAPVLANGMLYVNSRDGSQYALDPDDGSVIWEYDTGLPAALPGLIGTPMITPSGDVCMGDGFARAYCIDGGTGTPIWGPKVLGVPLRDAVWSATAEANGRLMVSIASLSDQPCTNGRLIALDLADGTDLWTLETTPAAICTTDTATECATNADCPGAGECVEGIGGGVTATVSFDSLGMSTYMNSVGCFTFPSIGDSDTIFKIDSATGAVVWKNRVDAPEQFGFCADDPSEDCGMDSQCTTGTCTVPKSFYHDFGFLNGPTPIEVPDGMGTKTILVSGSKNGTLYALNETDGTIAWTHAVQPTPITPGFAGFGLFNAPLAIDSGMIVASLYQMIPERVCDLDNSIGCVDDGDCPGGICLAAPEHLMAFDAVDGSVMWTSEIGPSWSGPSIANGVIYVGTEETEMGSNESFLYAHDQATGQRLATYSLPNTTSSRALIDGDSLYVGHGVFTSPGGVVALELRCPDAPQTGCIGGQKASFQVKKKGGGKDSMKFKITKGDAFDQAALGTPQVTTSYSVCAYDQDGGLDERKSFMVVGPGSAWQSKDPKGFNYKDKVGTSAGVTNVQLKAGAAGKTKVQVKAKGANLIVPDPVAADQYFNQDTAVTVQVIADGGVDTCFTAEFLTNKKNDGGQFKAVAP